MSVKLKTTKKIGQILDCFSTTEPSWSATELSLKLNIPVTTIHGILADLVALDFLDQNPQTKEYRIGFRYMEMGVLHSNSFELNNIAHGLMKELTLDVGHFVGLSVLYRGWMYISMSILPQERASEFRYAGSRFPAHLTAGGMAILAHVNDETIKQYCSIDWENSYASSIGEKELHKHITTIKKAGYATPFSATINSRPRSIAAPVFGRSGKILASLVIIGHREGFSQEEIDQLVKPLVSSADQISMRSAHLNSQEKYV